MFELPCGCTVLCGDCLCNPTQGQPQFGVAASGHHARFLLVPGCTQVSDREERAQLMPRTDARGSHWTLSKY